jgi:hypothetical protein
MRRLYLGLLTALPLAVATPASALPGSLHDGLLQADARPDLIVVRGGYGHGHAWGRGHGHRAFGWSRGRKVGWRGHGCPPGLWKQGRC